MKTINITLQEIDEIPQSIKEHKNYNPTLDFNKTYKISKEDIKNHQIKTNKFLNKNQWSSEFALLKSLTLDLAFSDGLKCCGNMPIFKIS